MERHIRVAIVHRILSWFYALGSVLILLLVLTLELGRAKSFNYLLVILFAGMFALHHFTAKGAKKKLEFAREASVVVGVIMLMLFPIGTLIGGFLLWNSRGWNTDSVTQEKNA